MQKTYKLLAPAHLVRVSFDQAEEGGNGTSAFACVPCEDELLRWYADHKLWVCPTCEQELHLEEAAWVLLRAEEALEKLKLDVNNKLGRKTRWYRRLWQALRR